MWLLSRVHYKLGYRVVALGLISTFACYAFAEPIELIDSLKPLDAAASYERHVSHWRRKTKCSCSKLSRFVDTLTDDVIDFHKSIGTTTTLKVIAATAILFGNKAD